MEQAQDLLKAAESDRLWALWVFLALTGCQRAEALALRCDAVLEINGQLAQNLASVGDARGPLADGQVQHFHQGVVVGKLTLALGQFA